MRHWFITILALACAAPGIALAQKDYPTKPIRLIVPFAPGGGTDIVARVMAQKVGEVLHQSVVVDNRGGAGGVIGMEMSVRATPDGYTLGIVSGSIATTAAAYKLPYDPVNDIAPISMIGETGYLVTVNPSLPVKNTRELIAYAKANPGKIAYGSSGTGSTSHLAGELFDLMAGVRMTHIPYKSSGPALADMIGGQIQMVYGSAPLVVPQMNSGRLRVLSITTLKRSRALPDIPTIAESGVPGYETITLVRADGAEGTAEGNHRALAGGAHRGAALARDERALRTRRSRRAGNRRGVFQLGARARYREMGARGQGEQLQARQLTLEVVTKCSLAPR